MKLLFFASDFSIGLSAVLTDQLIAYNSVSGFQIIGISGEKSQEVGLSDRISAESIELFRISGLDDHKDFSRLFKEVKAIINIEKPNIVHAQNNWQLALVGLIKYFEPKIGFKIVYTIHGFRNYSLFKSFIARILIGFMLFLFADRVIYMSEYVRKKFRILSYKMTRVYYGIDDRFFEKSENVIDATNLKLIYPAQFRLGKNQELLIRAFAAYCIGNRDKVSTLYLPGEGEFKKKCMDLALSLKISDQVHFPGLLSLAEIRNMIELCNIVVITSNSETFGKAVVEGYVLGKCIITTKVGVAPDVIEEGVNGYFFKYESELKSLLLKLSCNKTLLTEIGNNNFVNRKKFSWEHSISDYSELLNQLLAK